MRPKLGVGLLLFLFVALFSPVGFCTEEWVDITDNGKQILQLDKYFINDVKFKNTAFKTVWVKLIEKQSPGTYFEFLTYVSENKQFCIHQTKVYENNRLTTIDGKENNPEAYCVSIEPNTIGQSVYDYIFVKGFSRDSKISYDVPNTPSGTSSPATSRPASKLRIGGGLFAE